MIMTYNSFATCPNNYSITSFNVLYNTLIGSMVKWLTPQTSNLRIASSMGSNPVRGKPRCFLEQETLYSFLSTG